MPFLEITLPKTEPKIKELLCARLTDLVERVAGFERDIFRIRFSEYEVGDAGVGGRLWDGKEGAPYLHFVLYSPRMRRSVKRELVRSLSRVFTEIIGHPDWLPVIHICEHSYDNVGVEGDLLSEIPELSARRFYYDLPRD